MTGKHSRESIRGTKIILATRTKKDDFEACKKRLNELFAKSNLVQKIYLICNSSSNSFKVGNIDCEVLFDSNPTGPTAFNLIIDKLNLDSNKHHLLTYSQEVEIQESDIKEMVDKMESNSKQLVVVGFRLRDNVLSQSELDLYSNGMSEDSERGIAYRVPWSTCALWNSMVVYGKGPKKLRFDRICEKNGNQLGDLLVKINGKLCPTSYQGMEDGLAIAKLVMMNSNLKYKLLERELSWIFPADDNRAIEQKKKMARKNIVLSTFMQLKGYSVDKLMKASIT